MIKNILLLSLTMALIVPVGAANINVGPALQDFMAQASSDEFVEVLVSFENDLDPAAIKSSRFKHPLSRHENYDDIMARLIENRSGLERIIMPELNRLQISGKIESFKFYTISKTVLIKIKVSALDDFLNIIPNVRLVNLNSAITLIEPVDQKNATASIAAYSPSTSLDAINVRSLWSRGLTGKGSLICSFDTGVEGDHPALSNSWRGNNGATSSASWYAPYGTDVPEDDLGHGTHIMGVMVGKSSTDTIGVAPGAQWISAAVVDQGKTLSTTLSDIISAFDWAVNPDGDLSTYDDIPDVINNSWGVPAGVLSDCDNTFWNAIDNVEAAGIVTIFAAGNEGPTAETIRNPADRASSPLNALCVGAVDPVSLIVADFSSRGPSSCSDAAIKPEIVAPGVDIYSSYKGGTYKLMSGTSMATPFISGIVALIRQYNPDATVNEIKNALIASAVDLGDVGEDNAYGHGLIDAAEVLNYISAPEEPVTLLNSYNLVGGNDSFADPGDNVAVYLTLQDINNDIDSVEVWLSTADTGISLSGDTIRFRFIDGLQYAISDRPFYFDVSSGVISGSTATLMMHQNVFGYIGEDSTAFEITLGRVLPGQIFTVNSGDIVLTASEFGQFGLGQGSIYQAGGEGLQLGSSGNLLYEGGVIAARSAQLLSDAIRDSAGAFEKSDFIPDGDNPDSYDFSKSSMLTASYSDDMSSVPLPVFMNQSVYAVDDNFVIVELEATNPLAVKLEELSFGLFFDFDIDAAGDETAYDESRKMIYQYSSGREIYIGLVGLSDNDFNFRAGLSDESVKAGFSQASKYSMIATDGATLATAQKGDWFTCISHKALQVGAFSSRTVAMALIAAGSLTELNNVADRAIAEYFDYTGIDDYAVLLPTDIELEQNYPNPFNPTTVIEYQLGSAGQVNLDVFNITGQKVRTLVEEYQLAGRHDVIWDGCDDNGCQAASGVYLYRITTAGKIVSRKMVLLK